MTMSEGIAVAALVLSVGTNVALYIHLSGVMNSRFDGVERRLELIQGALHELDMRVTRLGCGARLLATSGRMQD